MTVPRTIYRGVAWHGLRGAYSLTFFGRSFTRIRTFANLVPVRYIIVTEERCWLVGVSFLDVYVYVPSRQDATLRPWKNLLELDY